MTAIALASVINHYIINGLHLFSDILYISHKNNSFVPIIVRKFRIDYFHRNNVFFLNWYYLPTPKKTLNN